MKHLFLFPVTLLILFTTNAQVDPGKRTQKQPIPPGKTDKQPMVIYQDAQLVQALGVVIFEHANFSGQNKVLGIGDHRLFGPTDFNDMISSIKVSPGFAVFLYEHADDKGGYGTSTDILEDVADLSVYSLNDQVSYISVFSTTNPSGMVWARSRIVNNDFVAGHWERKRANGTMPVNTPPAIVTIIPSRNIPLDDIEAAPMATESEINEFNEIQTHQMGVGVLGGETTKPFYYHHNQSGEQVYKYNKVIDPQYLPGAFFDWLNDKLGRFGFVVTPVQVVTELASDIKDFIFGSSSTKMQMDCWYPVSEYKKTVCGKLKEDAFTCSQDYLHTKVTIDKDVCYNLMPSAHFTPMLTNRWTGETHDKIEGEVKATNLANYNTSTGKSTETTTPKNPMLLEVKENEDVCLFGPWMGDIMDLNFKVPVPLTSSSVDLGNIDLRKNNEIHPVNQIWKKKGKETHLIAVVDGTGYFQKMGNREIAASGLNQRMRFYLAFMIPAKKTALTPIPVYDINGIGFDFTANPANEVAAEKITLKQNGVDRIIINDNPVIRNQRTHKVFFEKVRKRANGSIQGYIVVETEPITKPGGSINIIVKDITVDNNPVNPTRPGEVIRQ